MTDYTDADFERDCKNVEEWCNAAPNPYLKPTHPMNALYALIADRNRWKALHTVTHPYWCEVCQQYHSTVDCNNPFRAERDALKAEVERLTFLHDLDHKLADQWQTEVERLGNALDEATQDTIPELRAEVEQYRKAYERFEQDDGSVVICKKPTDAEIAFREALAPFDERESRLAAAERVCEAAKNYIRYASVENAPLREALAEWEALR